MSRSSISAESISDADALARALYRKARLSGPDFADVATVVRGLHTVLKHLRVEAEDPDSLLNTNQQQHSVYARQLAPIVEDCDFTLKQLDTILEKYGGSSADSPTSPSGAPQFVVGTVESREKDMIALIRTKLANQKTNIDIFLDTVQLHNPAKAQRYIDNTLSSNPHQLVVIKDKVAAIAQRMAQRRPSDSPTTSFAPTATASGSRNSTGSDQEEEELWQQFYTELTKEGFSSEVLMRHKEVLRAYIRELDSNGLLDGNSQPSVRGLLDEGPAPALPPRRGPPVTITPATYAHELPAGPDDGMSPKEVVYPATENEKFLPSVKLDRRPPDYSNAGAPPPSQPRQNMPLLGQSPNQTPNPNLQANVNMNQSPPPQSQQGQLQSYNPYRPQALGLDQQIQGQPQPSGENNQLQTYNYPYAPPSPRHLQPPSFRNSRSGFSSASGESDSDSDSDYSNNMRLISGLSLISTLDLMQLDQRAAEQLASRMAGMHLQPQLPAPQYPSPGTSPSNRYLPAPPQPSDHVLSSSPGQMSVSPRYVPSLPPPYTSPTSSISSPTMVVASPPPAYNGGPSTALQPHQQVPRLYSRLQPDSEGRDIPLEAMWTKIRRTLVSPEVLSKAGVRYEARPDFVAVLGVLTRAQIAEFARQSDEVRRQRGGYGGGGGKNQYPPPRYMRGGNGTGSFRDEKRRTGSTSDSESENLWDESDTSSDEERDRRRESRRYRRERDRDSKSEKDRLKERDEKERQQSSDKEEDKGTKVYPFILPLSAGLLAKGASSTGGGDSKGGPSSSAQPKPILKNKNENHVRFHRDGPIEISPEEAAAEQRQRERRNRERADRDRDRDWDRERDRARDRERRRRDREADRSADRSDRSRDDREHRSRDRDHHHHRSSRHHRGSHSANDDRSSRDRDAPKNDKRKDWGQKAKYAGIGGAAASLLNVLSEAASGF